MTITMELSVPLGMHLHRISRNTHNILSSGTHENWGFPERRQGGISMDEFVFINNCTDRADATVLFASILRSIYDHPNWSQLYDFFTKRYASDQTLLDLEARKLSAPAGSSQGPEKHKTVHFKTDPSSVGLPRDLPAHLAEGCRGARGNIVNSDPLPCAIGPAISVAMGPGAYMDLTYMGQPPGKYPAHDPATVKPNECDDGDSAREVASAIPSANMGGRGRSWAEWADLWRVIAEWVYEYDATSLQLNFWDGLFGYKRVLNDQERLSVSSGARVPRDCLSTHALDAADAIRDIFSQLDARPTDFQGLEWDYLEIEVPPRLRWAFYQRFGHKDADHKKNLEALVRRFPQNELDRLDYSDVKPTALKPCPDSFRGIDWEAWMLSIEGGNVVVIKTLFQVSERAENITTADMRDYYILKQFVADKPETGSLGCDASGPTSPANQNLGKRKQGPEVTVSI